MGILAIIGVLGFAGWRFATASPSFGALVSSVTGAPATSIAPVLLGEQEPEAPRVDPAVLGDLGEAPAPRERYPHIVPQPGDAIRSAKHTFRFEGEEYTVAVDVDPQLYWGAVASEHVIATTETEPEDERNAAIYRYMVQDPLQAQVIDDVSAKLRKIANQKDLSSDRYVEFIAKYVQSMPYDFDKLADPDADARFPVETLVERTGVCSDKSMLLVALLAHEGYDVALLVFDAENHMTAGIKGPGEAYGSSGYLLIESTTPAYIAEIPEQFVSGIRLESDAHVIPIGTGDTPYGAAERTARILAVRAATRPAAEALQNEAAKLQLTQQQADEINAKLKAAYESQFKLASITDHEDEFLDSKGAERWIERYCWWD